MTDDNDWAHHDFSFSSREAFSVPSLTKKDPLPSTLNLCDLSHVYYYLFLFAQVERKFCLHQQCVCVHNGISRWVARAGGGWLGDEREGEGSWQAPFVHKRTIRTRCRVLPGTPAGVICTPVKRTLLPCAPVGEAEEREEGMERRRREGRNESGEESWTGQLSNILIWKNTSKWKDLQ